MTDREEARCANCDAFPLAVGLAQVQARLAAAEADAARLAEALGDVVNHFAPDVVEWGVNAPGHGHEVPGIWDDDNPPHLAGKPCEWCAQWQKAREYLAAHTARLIDG